MASSRTFYLFLLLLLIFQFFLAPVLINSQMIPISDVKTHPPSSPPPSTSASSKQQTPSRSEGKPFTQQKIDIHKKIAANHLKQENEEEIDLENYGGRVDSFPTVEIDTSTGSKIIRKDKSPELQNPAKHSSDSNLLNFLLDQYKQITSTTSSSSTSIPTSDLELQLEILQNIQYFTHKYENGRDLFQGTNALETILLPGLNSTYYEIRQSICSIFAIAGQNNLIVQELSLNAGVLRQLIQLINTDSIVRPKALYALSSLLRNFIDGQKKFIKDGGLQILVNIASLSETRQKSLTLLIDLIKEHKYGLNGLTSLQDGPEEEEEAAHEMQETTNLLITNLKKSEWCQLLLDNLNNLNGFGQDDQLLIIDAIYYSSLELNICNLNMLTSFKVIFVELQKQFVISNAENNAEAENLEETSSSTMTGTVEFHFVDEELIQGIESLSRIINAINSQNNNNSQNYVNTNTDRDEL